MASAFLDRVSNKALGELLVEKGALSEVQVNEALEVSRNRGVRLGEALISLGYLSRDALGYAIGEQYGLKPMVLQPSMVDVDLVARFDFNLLNSHTMLPLIMLGNDLVVVVSDPNDQQGLIELARILPNYTITPQLGAADQIRRCLEAVRPQVENISDLTPPPAENTAARGLPYFTEIPAPDTQQFLEWLLGLAVTNSRQDVLIRDIGDGMQVSLTPERAATNAALTQIADWTDHSTAALRHSILQRARPLEHTRGQAARWAYSMNYEDRMYDFLIIMPIAHSAPSIFIRALHHSINIPDNAASDVPLAPSLEAGKYTVVLYDESVSLEKSLAHFIAENADNHTFVISQLATRAVFDNALAYPAPFGNMVTAVQAAAGTCAIFDHPVEYREAIRLLTSTYPPPAVLVCAPLPSHEGGAGSLSPDVEELITRQGAQSVRLMDTQPENLNSSSRGNS